MPYRGNRWQASSASPGRILSLVRRLEEHYCQLVQSLAVYHYERAQCLKDGNLDLARSYDKGIQDLMARKNELETVMKFYEYTPGRAGGTGPRRGGKR